MDVETARIHVNEAIKLLAVEMYSFMSDGVAHDVRQDCMAMELERMDSALGGNTLLSGCARDVRLAFVELLAARDALCPTKDTPDED